MATVSPYGRHAVLQWHDAWDYSGQMSCTEDVNTCPRYDYTPPSFDSSCSQYGDFTLQCTHEFPPSPSLPISYPTQGYPYPYSSSNCHPSEGSTNQYDATPYYNNFC